MWQGLPTDYYGHADGAPLTWTIPAAWATKNHKQRLAPLNAQALAFSSLSRFIFETSVVGLIPSKTAAPSAP